MKLKDYFNIPNCLSYLRIILLPVFFRLYTTATKTADFVIAFAVLAVAMLTDMFDGMIARRFNMITEWGKMLDPISDKLLQFFLAMAIMHYHPNIRWFLIVFVIKELYMTCMGLYLIKSRNLVIAAQFYGKVTTVVIDVFCGIMLLLPAMDERIATAMVIIMTLMVIYTGIRYFIMHLSILKGKEN